MPHAILTYNNMQNLDNLGLEEEEIKIEYNESFERDPLQQRLLEIQSPVNANLPMELSNFDNGRHSEINSKGKTHKTYWYKALDNKNKYLCKFCELSYVSVQTLRHHIKMKHPEEAKVLKEVISRNRRITVHKCHICQIKFSNVHQLKTHLTSHRLEDAMCGCDCCTSVKIHEGDATKSSADKRYKCPFCSAHLSRKYALNRHIRTVHESELESHFSCSFCPYKTPLKYYLKTHIASKHPDTEYARSQRIHFCSTCGYRTIKKSHFLTHKKLHLNETEKSNKCSFCDYSTVNIGNLKVHLRVHTKEKPYVCDINGCKYKCSAKSALDSHRLRHNREENMIYCDKCSYKTLYRHCLKRHYVRHGEM